VLLNLLSFGALVLLGWYVGRRCPAVPRWFLWLWVFFAPWTLDFSTEINNPSYVLTGAVLFFVGVFEIAPPLRIGALSPRIAAVIAGFGVLWVYQLHLSFVLLVPVLGAALLRLAARDVRLAASSAGWCAFGAAVAGLTLAPTLVRFGPTAIARGTGASITLDWDHLLRLPEVVARFLSFGSIEVPRFVGAGTEARLIFLSEHWWSAPFVVFATLVGIAQAIVLLVWLFRRTGPPVWPAVRWFTIALLVFVYVSFAFSVKSPSSHTFYVVLPAVTIYSFYVWEQLLASKAIRAIAVALLVSGAVTHVAIAKDRVFKRSLYADRPLVVRAIKEKDYRLLGERRPEIWKTEKKKN
jgi:hypothetical protein